MFIRTGTREYEYAVVISDPQEQFDTVAAVSIEEILKLQHTRKPILMNPALDFENGVTAGRIDVTPEDKRRLARWIAAGYVITLKTPAYPGARYRFGRVPLAKLGMTEEQLFWLSSWCEAMDYEMERRQVVQPRPKPQPAPRPAEPAQPKLKRKDRRAIDRRRIMEIANDY